MFRKSIGAPFAVVLVLALAGVTGKQAVDAAELGGEGERTNGG